MTEASPNKRRGGRARIAALVAAALLLGGCWGLRSLARSALYPIAHIPAVELPTPALLPGASLEPLRYRSADDIELRGQLFRCGRDGAPMVVFFHGNGQRADSAGLWAAGLGTKLSVDVLAAEYRGYNGPGSPDEEGLYADGRAAVKASGVDPAELILAGWSLGTGVAVKLASEGTGKALVLLAPYTSIVEVARAFGRDRERLARLGEMLGGFGGALRLLGGVVDSPAAELIIADAFNSLERVEQLRQPLFIVHGDGDEIIPSTMSEQLFARSAAAPSAGRLWIVPGASHFVIQQPEVLEAFGAALQPD